MHVGVKEAPRGVYQLRGEAFEGRTFLHRRKVVCVLLTAVGRCLCLGTLGSHKTSNSACVGGLHSGGGRLGVLTFLKYRTLGES